MSRSTVYTLGAVAAVALSCMWMMGAKPHKEKDFPKFPQGIPMFVGQGMRSPTVWKIVSTAQADGFDQENDFTHAKFPFLICEEKEVPKKGGAEHETEQVKTCRSVLKTAFFWIGIVLALALIIGGVVLVFLEMGKFADLLIIFGALFLLLQPYLLLYTAGLHGPVKEKAPTPPAPSTGGRTEDNQLRRRLMQNVQTHEKYGKFMQVVKFTMGMSWRHKDHKLVANGGKTKVAGDKFSWQWMNLIRFIVHAALLAFGVLFIISDEEEDEDVHSEKEAGSPLSGDIESPVKEVNDEPAKEAEPAPAADAAAPEADAKPENEEKPADAADAPAVEAEEF